MLRQQVEFQKSDFEAIKKLEDFLPDCSRSEDEDLFYNNAARLFDKK